MGQPTRFALQGVVDRKRPPAQSGSTSTKGAAKGDSNKADINKGEWLITGHVYDGSGLRRDRLQHNRANRSESTCRLHPAPRLSYLDASRGERSSVCSRKASAETEGREWVCKPGSVIRSPERSKRRSFICARRLLAASIATYPNVQRNGPPRATGRSQPLHSVWSSSGWGLPSRSSHPDRWCALTAPFHPYHALPFLPAEAGRAFNRSAVCSLLHFP